HQHNDAPGLHRRPQALSHVETGPQSLSRPMQRAARPYFARPRDHKNDRRLRICRQADEQGPGPQPLEDLMKSNYQLTPEIQNTICAYIRAGGYPHVAAEAAGIPKAVFDSWLVMGRKKRAKPHFKALCDAIKQAQAQARLGAEVKVFDQNPSLWLKSG